MLLPFSYIDFAKLASIFEDWPKYLVRHEVVVLFSVVPDHRLLNLDRCFAEDALIVQALATKTNWIDAARCNLGEPSDEFGRDRHNLSRAVWLDEFFQIQELRSPRQTLHVLEDDGIRAFEEKIWNRFQIFFEQLLSGCLQRKICVSRNKRLIQILLTHVVLTEAWNREAQWKFVSKTFKLEPISKQATTRSQKESQRIKILYRVG